MNRDHNAFTIQSLTIVTTKAEIIAPSSSNNPTQWQLQAQKQIYASLATQFRVKLRAKVNQTLTALRSFLMSAMGFLFRPLWNLTDRNTLDERHGLPLQTPLEPAPIEIHQIKQSPKNRKRHHCEKAPNYVQKQH
jgi:hypothetical protein